MKRYKINLSDHYEPILYSTWSKNIRIRRVFMNIIIHTCMSHGGKNVRR